MEFIIKLNQTVNSFVWGPIMLALLVGTGIYITVRTNFMQVRRFGYILKHTVGSLFQKSDKNHGNNLSPFQASPAQFLPAVPALCSGCGFPHSSACALSIPRLLWL